MKAILFAILAAPFIPCQAETAAEQVARVAAESAKSRGAEDKKPSSGTDQSSSSTPEEMTAKWEAYAMKKYPELQNPTSHMALIWRAYQDELIENQSEKVKEPSYISRLADGVAKKLLADGYSVTVDEGKGPVIVQGKPKPEKMIITQTYSPQELEMLKKSYPSQISKEDQIAFEKEAADAQRQADLEESIADSEKRIQSRLDEIQEQQQEIINQQQRR